MDAAKNEIECLYMHVTLYMQGKHVMDSCSYSHVKTVVSRSWIALRTPVNNTAYP